MIIADKERAELEALVGELEKGSSAEVVVAVARQSGSYGELDLLFPLLCSWMATAFLVFSPFVFPEWTLVPGIGLAFLIGFAISRLPGIRSRLPRARRRRQVEDAARAAFVREHVSATQSRTGILIYLSLREGEVEIVPDYGVQSAVPDAHWNSVLQKVRAAPADTRCATLVTELRALAPVLAQQLPRSSDDKDELSNAPRMLI